MGTARYDVRDARPHTPRGRGFPAPGAWPVTLALLCLLNAGCYERVQTAVLNPDGSGKMTVETLVAVPATGAPGREKPTAVSFGRQVAADLINSTRGVDGWADASVSEAADGRARIVATAYFPDISKVRFDMPLEFVWQKDTRAPDTMFFAIQRVRTPVAAATTQDPTALRDLVGRAQAQYREQQLALQTQLAAFKLQMTFHLPGQVAAMPVLELNGQTISLTIEGKKLSQALDRFMADDALLTATVREGRDLPENDDAMLNTMYGKSGPVVARVKLTPDAPPAFDYKAELYEVQRAQGMMLQEAGIELIPRFIVRPPATTGASATQATTQPAAKPATLPAD